MKDVSWISTLLYSKFKPEILVCFGLNSICKNQDIGRMWNHENGLNINWDSPHDIVPFNRYNYSFRFWNTIKEDGNPMAVIMWPNHPSHHPFAGNSP